MSTIIKRCNLSEEYYFDEGCYITEVSNSADDSQLSIARARVKPGVTTSWHLLNGITERYVILDGTGRVEVADLESTSVNTGDVVIIKPGQKQRICNTGSCDLLFLAICSPRFVRSAYVSLEAE